jgi:hypothetical protein
VIGEFVDCFLRVLVLGLGLFEYWLFGSWGLEFVSIWVVVLIKLRFWVWSI